MTRRVAIGSLGALALIILGWANSANACWGCWGHRVWYPGPLTAVACWTPCWSAYSVCPPCDLCCDPCGDVEWVLGVRPGPIRRLLFGPYRWYPVVGSACTVCGMSPCACEPAEVTMPSAVTAPGPSVQPSPTPAPPAQPAPAVPAPGAAPGPQGEQAPPAPTSSLINPTSYAVSIGTAPATRQDSGILTVYVPAEAKVIINGLATKSTGTRREYVSYGLQEGLQYKYVITAQLERDGKIYEETREVILTAGAKKGVAFSFQFPSENLAGLTNPDRM